MKNLVNMINEALSKSIKEGAPLLEVSDKNITMGQRGAKKYINADIVEADYKNIGNEINKLSLYSYSHSKIDDLSAKMLLLILSKLHYSKDYKKMEKEAFDIANEYSNTNIKSIKIVNMDNRYIDLEGNLYIVVSFNGSAKIEASLYLEGFVAKQYKVTPVHMGVDIDYDEYSDDYDENYILNSVKNKIPFKL